jgi:hypothetical protein
MVFRSRDLPRRLAAESPVVIMARGHSGTRILAWAIQKLGIDLGASEDVATGDVQDLRFSRTIKRVCRATLHEPPTTFPRPRCLRTFQRAVASYQNWLGDTSGGWGWKFPETYLIPNYVAATFPQARYIHMLRDGRDLAFKDHLTDDPNRRLGYRLLKHIGALGLPHHVQAAMSWQFQVRRYDEFVQYAQPTVHRVDFERLCQDPLGTMAGVCEFLDREMTDDARQFLATQINPEKIAQYRREDVQQVAEAEAAIAPLLADLGYLTKQAA